MKRIDELSKKEVLALTKEEISKLIDLECAHANVPLLPEMPVKPTVEKYDPDLQVYELLGFYFMTPEEPASILEAFSKTTPYAQSYDDKFPKPLNIDAYSYPKVTSKKLMSAEMYNRVKAEKDAADVLVKEYEAKKRDYDRIAEKRKEHSDHVWNIVNEVRDEQDRKDWLKLQFERYLELADGNRVIAWNFLKNTHPDAEEIDGLFEELTGAKKV